MAKTKYVIELSEEEKNRLHTIINDKDESERTRLRARILLMSDAHAEGRQSVVKLAESLGTTHTTIQTVRTEYGKNGLEAAVFRKLRTDNRTVTSDVEEQIRQLLAEEPPKGKKKWSVRLLCQACVERGIIEHISVSTMHGVLQKIRE